jgi:hypothetical protein
MEHTRLPVSMLDGHRRNYRSHPPEQIKHLVASLQRFSQVKDIVVRKNPHNERYTVIAGHGVVEAARACFLPELSCVVVPESWSDQECEAYLVADNHISQGAVDDDALLVQLLTEQSNAGYDLASLGSDEESLRQMLESLGDEYLAGDEGEEDEVSDELPEEVETRARLGDVWALGRHVIACVNSCDEEAVRRVIGNELVHFVFADPPYGISAVGKDGRLKSPKGELAKVSIYSPIIGDDTTDTAETAYRLCVKLFPSALHLWWGANHYSHVFPSSSCWIVWDKQTDGMAFADAELAYCSHKSAVRIFQHQWKGLMKGSEQGQKRVHPSQKPVALCQWAFEKYGEEQDVIFDPFLGSGISVIAAEKMSGNRKVYGCELSPEYIDVIIARWEKLTGEEATLLERIEEAVHG